MRRPILFVLVMIAALGVAVPASAATTMSPTFAYIDPATGTLILSAIIGAFAAIGMFVKKYWYRIKRFLTGGKPEPATVQKAGDNVASGTESSASPD